MGIQESDTEVNFKKTHHAEGGSADEASGEIIYGIFRNVDTVSTVVGGTASMAMGTAIDRPGLDVDMCGSSGSVDDSFVGIWTEITAQSKHGLVQLYGYCPTVLVGISSITAGDTLKAVSGVSHMQTLIIGQSGPGQDADYDSHIGFVVALAANEVVTVATIPGFIRAM